MTDIVSPEEITSLPPAPEPLDTPEVFNTKSFASLAAQLVMIGQINAVASVTHQNAVAAQERASAAQALRNEAQGFRNEGEGFRNSAADASASALAYAQAAQAAAGVPQPTPFGVYAADDAGHPGWRDLAALPAMQGKADKDGAVVTRLSTNRIAYAPAAGATQVLDVSLAGEFVLTPAGTCTLAWANVPAGNVSFVLTLDCVNFGGKVINFPAGTLFIKADKTIATSVGNSGITWQTNGTDFLLVWFKNGVPYCKAL